MKVSLYGYDKSVATFFGENLSNGDIVKISDSFTVEKANAGDDFCGVVIHAEKGYVSVQTKGYVELPCAGLTDLGYTNLESDGDKGVVEGSGSRQLLVVSLESGLAGIIL